ncbi:MAG: mandelate racemase/muconate lactonizing enzyme family protein [Planctomycetota bacterium]|nr:mandelate racemase/muconate lactonizing enzyme family protein [Planctomycetota bacterium]MDA1214902.1 mandelate racemase/muconate lactonizing enzyme family protein [Planctomycetota bacterium]
MKITRVEIRVVTPQVTRYTWSHDLPEQFMTNTIVRIETDEGITGIGGVSNYTSYDFDRYTAETMRHLIPILIGRNPLERETLWYDMFPRVFPLSPTAMTGIDIALWDLLGRVSNLPIYQLLGGARDRILSYASTPLFADVEEYRRCVDDMIAKGFKAIKFHAWCLPDKDLELCRAVRKDHPGDDIAFMHDAENRYDRESSLRVARELEDLGFTWFEAPLPDYDFEGYQELTRRVNIPVIPSGNWIQDLPSFARAIQMKAWRTSRTDVTMCGGFTGGRKAMAIAHAAGQNCEIMCWGHTLISTANLHLALSMPNCKFYEQPIPYDSYEYGMKTVTRTQPDGYVYAPQGSGLGVEIDWEKMDAATIMTIDSNKLRK